MIIGLCGLQGSGKDTVADYLVKNLNFTKMSFADPVKSITSIIFDWDRKLLEGDTCQSREFREKKDEWWSQTLNENITPRKMLQYIGTDLFRHNFNSDIWVKILEKKILNNKSNIVISDCRFPNEIKMLKKNGAIIIRIIREQKNLSNLHESDLALINEKYDIKINNTGTKQELYSKIFKKYKFIIKNLKKLKKNQIIQ